MLESFQDKTILVTGGTGTIGRELVRQVLEYNPKVVRVFSRDESKQHDMRYEFREYKHLRYFIGDVRDKERLALAIEDVDIVFHIAALKHVLACEYNPFEVVKTNILGTQNVIDVSLNEEVDKVILTSTDKAVNPSNAMGTSKLMAEKLITAANYYKGERKTVFATVRFGNVLGSRGSVIPLFKQHIKEGCHVTITHPDMTRYVMSLAESLQLIFYATEMALGGEIFIPKMPAVKIVDLANAMIEELAPKYGYNPKDVRVEIIGVKPGEKLYEEMMTEAECSRALETDKMFIILPQLMDEFRHIDYKYTGAKMITSQNYTSRDVNFLQKDEIKLLLHKEGLLEE